MKPCFVIFLNHKQALELWIAPGTLRHFAEDTLKKMEEICVDVDLVGKTNRWIDQTDENETVLNDGELFSQFVNERITGMLWGDGNF
ncbi:MAG: hypothetical protein RL768_431 [Nitrospirota bacterium]